MCQAQCDQHKASFFATGSASPSPRYFVKGLAREIGFNAVALNMQNILGGIVGQSERNLARPGVVKSLAPCLVLMDELDQSDVSARGNASRDPANRGRWCSSAHRTGRI